MADLYSILPGIQPDQQDIIEAELLSKQILEANFPDLDLREGTALRDLTIRPCAFLLALCKKGFDFYFDQRTISNISNESSQEIVDSLMGNLFLARKQGNQAVINVRLSFARQKAVSLTSSTSFSTDGNLLFYPVTPMVYPATAMQFDAFQNEYFLDVDLIAAASGDEYNIGSGSLLYFSNFDPFFLHGEINYLAQSGIAQETNEEFVARAETAVSTRNLVNKPSIDNRLRADLSYVDKVHSIGAGDDEMYRDQVEILGYINEGKTAAVEIVDFGANLQFTLVGHGFQVGQLINVTELGTIAPGDTQVILTRVRVAEVVSSDVFKTVIEAYVQPRVINPVLVAAVEDSLFVHQGGSADVHCSYDLVQERQQYQVGEGGKLVLEGPILSVKKSETPIPGLVDTVLGFFNLQIPIYSTRADITLVQDIDNVLNLTVKGHCLKPGRMVRIEGWPSVSSVMYFMVSSIVDENTVTLGMDLPDYAVGENLNPRVTFVYPYKDVGFSTRQSITLDFGAAEAFKLVTLDTIKFNNLDSIQGYLDAEDRRLVCADLLARGFDIFYLQVSLKVHSPSAPSSAEVETAIRAYLKSLAPGQTFIAADMVAALTQAGIDNISTPVGVFYRYFTKDLFPAQSGLIVDKLEPLNSTSVFVLELATVNIFEPA